MNIPKLRFKEFNDEYNLIVLNDILISHNAGIYIEKSKYGAGTNIVGVSNLYDNTKIDGQIFRLAPLTEEEKTSYLLDENDIIYGESSLVPIGIARTLAVTSNGKNTAFEWHTRRFKINNNIVNSFYLSYMFNFNNKIRKHLASVSTQTALTGITTKDFFSTKFYIPKLQEQNKVVKMLDLLDKKIELQSKKIEDLKLFKLYISKLLFKENKNIKLKEICECKTSNISLLEIENDDGIYPIYGANGEIKKISSFQYEKEYLAIIKDGAGVGKNFVCNNNSSIIGTLNALIPYNIPIYYFKELISNINFNKYIVGSGIPHIYFNDYSNEKVCKHDEETICKANKLFKNITYKINLEEEKLNKLQKLKKGLMQSMFV